jgi:hypothetical protein
MLRARRWPAVRLCLLVVGVMLWSATVAFATGTDRLRAAASQPHRATSKRRVAGKKSSSARPTKCVVKARGGQQRKTARSCVVKRSKTRRTKLAVSRKRLGAGVPSSYFAFRDTLPLDAESIYTEPDVSESLSSTEPPSESVSKPDEPITPVERAPVNERVVPVERTAPSKPAPVTDPVAPVGPIAPVEPPLVSEPVLPVAPVEEPAPVTTPPTEPPPVSEPVAPVDPVVPSEPVAPVEEPAPVIEPVAPVKPPPVSEPVTPTEPVVPSEPVAPVEEPAPVTTVPSEPPPVIEPVAPVEPPPVSEPVTPVEPSTPFRFFSATSVWNAPLSSNAPLDPSSAGVVGAFEEEIATEVQTKTGPATINTTSWSVPIYTVPAGQPTVQVTLENASPSPPLQSAWDAVPLPSDAHPAAGTDEHLVVWQPSTDRLWEFWRLAHGATGWEASWGGAIQNASSNSGAYSPEAWPGAKTSWGASASSLSIAGGLLTLEDLERGRINHALALSLPAVRARAFASPAQRTDGESTQPLSLPEGAHLRLDPNLDLASLHLPHLTLLMAEAAQRYGIVVRDKASNVTFYAQDPTPTGTNPYVGPQGYFEGKSPRQFLASFPWSHLQLLKMELHSIS